MVSRREKRARAKTRSPGLGVSGIDSGSANLARMDAGSFVSKSYFSITAQASATVVGSGRVGPEAIDDSNPAGTSVMARVSFSDDEASAARRPPLTAERCLRTELISLMEAPHSTNT